MKVHPNNFMRRVMRKKKHSRARFWFLQRFSANGILRRIPWRGLSIAFQVDFLPKNNLLPTEDRSYAVRTWKISRPHTHTHTRSHTCTKDTGVPCVKTHGSFCTLFSTLSVGLAHCCCRPQTHSRVGHLHGQHSYWPSMPRGERHPIAREDGKSNSFLWSARRPMRTH